MHAQAYMGDPMHDTTLPVPRSSPSGGRVWLLPSSPFEVAVEESREEEGALFRPLFRPLISGNPLPPPRSAAA